MAGTVTVEIKGLEDVQSKLTNLAALKSLRRAVSQGAVLVAGAAKMLAPVDTEDLRKSIKAVPAVATKDLVAAEVVATSDHAAFVEFGTGRRGNASAHPKAKGGFYDPTWAGMRAQPYMYPAAKQNKHKVVELIKDAVQAEAKHA